MLQVWLTVIWNHLGTLLMNIQTTIYGKNKGKTHYCFHSFELECLFWQKTLELKFGF
jgi:hypothetical protein